MNKIKLDDQLSGLDPNGYKKAVLEGILAPLPLLGYKWRGMGVSL